MELREIEADRATLALTRDELLFLSNAMNEALHGVDGWQFGKGRSYWKGREVLADVGSIFDSLD